MTKMDLVREIGMIDEKYIVEAEAVKRSVLVSPIWRRSLATAACLCLCIGLYFSVQRLGFFSSSDNTAAERISPMETAVESMEDRVEVYTVETATEEAAEAKFETVKEEFVMSEKEETVENGLPGTEVTQGSSYDSASSVGNTAQDLNMIEKRFADYPDEVQSLVEEGLVVNLHGELKGGQERLDAFIKNVEEGKAADMDLVQFTVEGDPIFYYIRYDGTDFYAVKDYSRDEFAGSGEKVHEYQFKYLKVFEERIEGGKRVEILLTDTEDLTVEEDRGGDASLYIMSYTE